MRRTKSLKSTLVMAAVVTLGLPGLSGGRETANADTAGLAAPAVGTLSPLSPVSPPGKAKRFTAVYSDPDGYRNLKQVFFRVHEQAGGITLRYDRGANRLYLYNNSGTAPSGSCTPGAPVILKNRQGSLNCAKTAVSRSGTDLTVKWSITPKPGFASATPRNLFMSATDKSGGTTGWVDAGDWWITPKVRIDALDRTGAAPGSVLTITGEGFTATGSTFVRFFDGGWYSVTVPVIGAGATSLDIVVPPYVNAMTGALEPGMVNVQVIQTAGTMTSASNVVSGFAIGALPALTLPPGEVSANVAGFLEGLFAAVRTRLSGLDAGTAEEIDTDALRARLESLQLQCGQLKTKIRAAIANPAGAPEVIGQFNGVYVTLDQASLEMADRWMVAVLNGVLERLQVPTSSPVNGLPEPAERWEMIGTGVPCNGYEEVCDKFGNSLLTVKNYRTGEETGVVQYHYGMNLPGAREILADISNKFAAATATIGAAVVTMGGSIPLQVTALLTTANVVGASAIYGMDATVLSVNSTDKAAAQRVLDDFNGQLEGVVGGVFSPILGGISQGAGVLFDLFMGWKATLETEMANLLDQASAWVAGGPRPCTSHIYWDWSACGADNTQTRSVIGSIPPGCTGGEAPVLSRPCPQPCCGCYSDQTTGGNWYCHTSAWDMDICPMPSGFPWYTVINDGACACDPVMYEVCF